MSMLVRSESASEHTRRQYCSIYEWISGYLCLIPIAIAALNGCAEAMANPLYLPMFGRDVKEASGAYRHAPDVCAHVLA
jgi:hypothetical protein